MLGNKDQGLRGVEPPYEIFVFGFLELLDAKAIVLVAHATKGFNRAEGAPPGIKWQGFFVFNLRF
jgi:hypothetical protein